MLETQVKKILSKIKLSKKEKILVAVSGGKDSSVTAYVLKKFGYNVEAIHINLGMGKYSEDCLRAVRKLCGDLEIRLYVFDINIKKIFAKVKKKRLSNCMVCGVIKKSILNKEARKLKIDKIATGHHLDDEVQTFVLNILKGSPELSASSGVITRNVSDKKFIPRLKLLFYILEDDIENYAIKKKIPFVGNICPYRGETYRVEVRNFLNGFSEKDKRNMMKNFLDLSKQIKEDDIGISYCEKCGEPARGKVCKVCEIVGV